MPRSNPKPSPLTALTDDQQQQLISWMDSFPPSEVIERVRRDPPDGFGIVTYDTSLRRFYARHKLASRGETISIAHEFNAQQFDEQPLDDATASATRQLAFEIANSPKIGLKQFKPLSRWVLKHRELEQRDREIQLVAQRLELDTERFRFNAARQALIHYAELAAIAKNHDKDNEDKIRAVADLLFQPAPPIPDLTKAGVAQAPRLPNSAPSPNSAPLQNDPIVPAMTNRNCPIENRN